MPLNHFCLTIVQKKHAIMPTDSLCQQYHPITIIELSGHTEYYYHQIILVNN